MTKVTKFDDFSVKLSVTKLNIQSICTCQYAVAIGLWSNFTDGT